MVLTIDHTITNAFVLRAIFSNNPNLQSINARVYKSHPSTLFKTLLLIACALNLAFATFLVHLTWLHIKLQREGITTFEYIKQKEKRQQSKIVRAKQNKDEKPKTPVPEVTHRINESIDLLQVDESRVAPDLDDKRVHG